MAKATSTKPATLTDKTGVKLERGMRVTTSEGLKAHVGRIDVKSNRAVVIFERPQEGAPEKDTMRVTNTLTVRKVAGKVLFFKEAAKAAKATKPEPKAEKPKASNAKKATAKKAPAKKAAKPSAGPTPAPTEVEPTAADLTDEPATDLDAIIASLPGEALEV